MAWVRENFAGARLDDELFSYLLNPEAREQLRAVLVGTYFAKEIQPAVRAIKLGAYEYVVKPFGVEEVRTIIERALEKRRLVIENRVLRRELDDPRYAHPKLLDEMIDAGNLRRKTGKGFYTYE
mgnify:CR=1 FL=1